MLGCIKMNSVGIALTVGWDERLGVADAVAAPA
jgi:hypothetical protein